FGPLQPSTTDRNTILVFSNNSNAVTTPTSVVAYKVNVAANDPNGIGTISGVTPNSGVAGSYAVAATLVEFANGYPSNYAQELGAAGTSYNHGDYIKHTLTGAEMAGGTGIWA